MLIFDIAINSKTYTLLNSNYFVQYVWFTFLLCFILFVFDFHTKKISFLSLFYILMHNLKVDVLSCLKNPDRVYLYLALPYFFYEWVK